MATNTLPEKPHQPRTLSFLKRSFGQNNVVQVSFKAEWFDKWSWLHYDEPGDVAFCHLCAKAEEQGKLKANTKAGMYRTWIFQLEGNHQPISSS